MTIACNRDRHLTFRQGAQESAVASTERQINGDRNAKDLGVLLIAGSVVQMTTASARNTRRGSAAATQQFRNANNSIDSRASTWCSTEAGNRYNPDIDYMACPLFERAANGTAGTTVSKLVLCLSAWRSRRMIQQAKSLI
jgi:hypothetical protein